MAAAPESVIPEGCTFFNHYTMITRKAADRYDELIEKMNRRDPDAFAMYIYNDFFNYAQLDLVDRELTTIHTKITKKNWDEAYTLLESLSAFLEFSGCSWPMVDDGEKTELTDKAYGASLVKVMRALKKEGRLDVEHFPTLETVLKHGTKWAQGMPQPLRYRFVLQGIGKRLFKDKPKEAEALEKKRVQEWIQSLPREDQKDARRLIKEQEEEDAELSEEEKKPWWDDDGAHEDDKDTELIFSRVWTDYKAHLREYPNIPMRGPRYWDLSTWSDADKAPFLFSNMDDSW